MSSLSPKVKPSREKRSLASRLSGYIPPKRKQDQGVSLPRSKESLDGPECHGPSAVRMLSTAEHGTALLGGPQTSQLS